MISVGDLQRTIKNALFLAKRENSYHMLISTLENLKEEFVEFKQTHSITPKQEKQKTSEKRMQLTQKGRESILRSMADELGFVVIEIKQLQELFATFEDVNLMHHSEIKEWINDLKKELLGL